MATCPEALGTHTDAQLPSSFSSLFILEPQPQEWFSAQSGCVWGAVSVNSGNTLIAILQPQEWAVFVKSGNTLIAIPRHLFPR